MSPIPVLLEKPAEKTIQVSHCPVQNIFSSMLLVAKGEQPPGVHEWINKTRASLSKKEFQNYELAIIGFYFALAPDDQCTSFPAYLEQLERADPEELIKKMLNAYAEISPDDPASIQWEAVLATEQDYIHFLQSCFSKNYIDEKLERKAYALVIDPPAMKDFLVSQMTWVWKTHFEKEWQRVEAMLAACIRSFEQSDLTSMSRLEAASFVTGQDVHDAKWAEKLEYAERVTFIPNPHLGPYVHANIDNGVLYVTFGARQPEGTGERIPDLDRAEIAARLSALADNTRLHILQLVASRGEIRSQEVLDEIDLSQPSVSRYLTQLTAAGYLKERRASGAKVYSLNRDQIEKTLIAVKSFLLE